MEEIFLKSYNGLYSELFRRLLSICVKGNVTKGPFQMPDFIKIFKQVALEQKAFNHRWKLWLSDVDP